MKKLILVLLFLSCVATSTGYALDEACSNTGAVGETLPKKIIHAIPAREQWNANSGYCGETSILSAGLYYGQYVSQYDARVLANINFPTKIMQANEILIGDINDSSVYNNITNSAINMHLNYEEFNNIPHADRTSQEFLTWIKRMLIGGYPTIIGVYENSSVFGQSPPDPEYDHIVPIFGIESQHNLNENPVTYYADDVIFLHDNGLFTGTGYSPQGCYQYEVGPFQKSREGADSPNAKVYSVSDNANKKGNYGIAITGVKGIGIKPITIQTNPNYEIPKMQHQSNTRPAPELMTLTIVVSNLTPNTSYTLLRYSNFNQLPINDDFSNSYGNPTSQCKIWITSGNTFTKSVQIYSNTMAIYRAVTTKSFGPVLPDC